MAAVDSYEQYKNAYTAQQNAINANNEAQILERQNRERQAQQELSAGNKAANTAFARMNSPQNRFQQQGNFSTGVSDYLKGANYSNYLKGLGANQQNYTQAINNSNALWNAWVAQKAGQEAENEGAYADRVAQQANTDRAFDYQKERDTVSDTRWQTEFDYNKGRDERDFGYQQQRDTVADTQWQQQFDRSGQQWQAEMDRQLNRDTVADAQWQAEMDRALANDKVSQQQWQAEMNRMLANDQISQQQWKAEMDRALKNDQISQAQWQAEMNRMLSNDAEAKRRYDQEWAYQLQQDALAKSAGTSGGSSSTRRSPSPGVVFDNNGDPFTGWNEENGYAVEYKDGVKTGKKIKSNTTGGGANNTSKATNIVPTGGTGGKSTSTTTKKTTPTYSPSKSSGKYSAKTYF